jgi:hypothetical protein
MRLLNAIKPARDPIFATAWNATTASLHLAVREVHHHNSNA